MQMAANIAADPAQSIVGKKQLCALLNWSRPTLDRRLDSDPNFPIRQRGDQRGGWEFDVAEVLGYLQPGTPATEAAPPAFLEPPPSPIGPPAPPPPAPAIKLGHQGEETARQRRDGIQAELLSDRLRRSRGELVEAAEVRMAMSTAVTKLSQALNALPDVLVRRLSLPDAASAVVRQEVDQARRAFVAQLRDLLAGE